MHRIAEHFNKRVSGFGWFLWLLLPLLLGGCASGGSGTGGPVVYGNPFYKHVRQLPENQVREQGAQEEAQAPDREMSARELEARGDSLLHQGHLAGAYTQFEASLAKAPDNPRVQVKMARVLNQGGYSDDALKMLRGVVDRTPDSADAREVMGIIHYKKGEYGHALTNFDMALALDAGRWQAYNYKGLILDIQKEHLLARQAFGKAIALRPGQGFLYNNLGVSYALAGKHQQAVQAFRRAIRLKYAPAKAFNNLGASLSALGRYGEAFEAFKNGVGEVRALNNLGCMYLMAGKRQAAIQSFEKAIALNPRFFSVAYHNLKKAEFAVQ
jgi:Flp pilus assembly protein TadD